MLASPIIRERLRLAPVLPLSHSVFSLRGRCGNPILLPLAEE
nr:MAG TPA: hypothetical protein [Caudoviricetes sp.]